MTDFKLCREAGLSVEETTAGNNFIWASSVEKLLAQAPVVTSAWESLPPVDERLGGTTGTTAVWRTDGYQPSKIPTHSARLIMVTPIVRDTAESLLQKLIDVVTLHDTTATEDHIIERAQRLLEKGK